MVCAAPGIGLAATRPSHPRAPTRLPLLFALDAKLQIANGFHYQPDGRELQRQGAACGGGYFGSDFCAASFSGDSQGFGGAGTSDGAASGGDSGGDGGSCGGGGD